MSVLARRMEGDEGARDKIAVIFAAASLSVVLLYRNWPSSRLWLPAALAGIALAIWHGAYDTVLAENLWQPRFPRKWLLPFVAAYVALAAAVLVAWCALPVAALAAFLLYSALHFGSETEQGTGPLAATSGAAFGALPIAAACHWQAGAVLPIFTAMVRSNVQAAARIMIIAGACLAPCIVLACVPVWRFRADGARRAALIVSLLLLFRFCTPVLAFAVFFALLHTPEHVIETSRDAAQRFSSKQLWSNLRAGVVPWLLSVAAVAIAAWFGRRTVQAYSVLVFMALSALTVPHMVLAMIATAKTRRQQNLIPTPARRPVHL